MLLHRDVQRRRPFQSDWDVVFDNYHSMSPLAAGKLGVTSRAEASAAACAKK
jgi:hypothetical protein